MNEINSADRSVHARQNIAFMGQVVFLFLLWGVGGALILGTIQKAALNAFLLLIFVSVGGLVLCRRTQRRLNDPALSILGNFWLVKLALTFLFLYAGWMPELDSASNSWGYDPQRYYIQAQELIDNNWATDFSLTYVGILYYYGVIYYVLGHNPVIPALINTFVTLVATLYLIRVGYEIKGQRGPRDWTLAFALLLPEMLWYDVMTSRETLLAALLLFAMLTTGRYFARTARVSLFKVLVIVGFSVIAIAAVRTSMLLPVVVSIALMVLLVKPRHELRVAQRIVISVAAITIFLFGPMITAYLSGYDFDVLQTFQTMTSAKENVAITVLQSHWSENSIGLLLMPEGLLQSLLFLPPRMLLYLVAPFPKVFVSVSDLMAGSYYAWQNSLTLLASIINVLAIPYALASFIQSVKTRKTNSAPLIFHISYWVTFMAIAGGNLIIQERYRVMATLLLWGCVWLGARTCSKSLIVKVSLFWYGLLTFGALFYVVYKFALV